MPAVEPTRTSEPWPRSATPRRNAARGQEARGQIRRRGCRASAEGQSQTGTSSRGQTPATAAQTSSRAGHREQFVDLGLVRQVGAGDQSAAELVRERLGAVTAAVVMDDDVGAFGGERTGAGRSDPAGRAGDEHAPCPQPGLHP